MLNLESTVKKTEEVEPGLYLRGCHTYQFEIRLQHCAGHFGDAHAPPEVSKSS